MNIKEVPSPIDLRNEKDAEKWASEANTKRPWRYEFFDRYVQRIQNLKQSKVEVLELGSGPGFLAKHLLSHCQKIKYSAFDFSDAMHKLSKSKLLPSELDRSKFYLGDFKTEHWNQDVGQYDVVIIHQALHELRHKAYAEKFHQKVKMLLKPNAIYLVCDHLFAENAMQNNQLYMSQQEHLAALNQASFSQVKVVMEKSGLCLFESAV